MNNEYQKGHKILSADPTTRRGVCSICGEVPVTSGGIYRYKGKETQLWRCYNAIVRKTTRITKPLEHYLSDVNSEARTAVCSKCGPVTIVKGSRGKDGQQFWRCRQATGAKKKWKPWHRLSNVDSQTQTAYCCECKKIVGIRKCGIDREGNTRWTCGPGNQKPKSQERPHVHNLISIDPSTRTGVCESCGPIKIVQRQTVNGEISWRCITPYNKFRLKQKYGLTEQDYKDMHAEQDGCCAICGTPKDLHGKDREKLAVDHDHKTEEVRGLLCFHCNLVLGHFKDNQASIFEAVEYLTNPPAKSGIQKKDFDVTEQWKQLGAQDGCCAICRVSDKDLVVDHNHTTGAVRGLLCQGCNQALGHAMDSPDVLRKAALYVESYAKDLPATPS